MIRPSDYNSDSVRNREKPDAELELEYIHGYRCADVRSNLRYTETGKIVFHAAGVGILLDQQENK